MIVLGQITEAYGVKGWLRIHPFADDPASWLELPDWYIQIPAKAKADIAVNTDDDSWQPVKVLHAKIQANGIIVQIDTITDRTAAEALRGALIAVPRTAMPHLAADEYYWADLIGLEVVNQDNQVLGQVTELLETGANAVMQVTDSAEKTRLLPFVATVVLSVDTSLGRIQVDWGIDW